MTRLQELEFEATRYAEIPSLPEAVKDDEVVWVLAIAKVLTRNNSEGYAIVRNSYKSAPAVLKTFGNGGIAKIISIHPYLFLDGDILPSFENAKQLKEYIAKVYGVTMEDVAKVKKDDLMKLFYNYCIKYQVLKITSEREEKEAHLDSK